LEAGNDICEVTVEIPFNGPKTITVPTGATAQMFDYNKYYDFTELDVKAAVDNGDGTTTYYFTSNSYDLSYRVSMEGYATKAGYWENKNITVTFDENSPKSDAPTSGNAIIDNSVLVNVNGQNHLNLAVDGTHKLKAYRAWEIIKYSYQNEIISPDFHFNVLSGEDVISLTPTASPSNGNDDWMIVKGLKEGTAILEVTYDAMQVTGSSWDGVYGASDPARTGLVVVQVGGNKANVDFGIKSKASLGSLDYSSSTPKAWDAEFDTLYFFGESGELEFAPTADSAITEVAVSNDKGETWNTLSANENLYTANIVPGNNIIRVTTENGVAYQVVRGDQLTYTMTIVQEEGAETVDTVVDPGDTVRIVFDGLHTPIPKMAGNYNPGYKGNYDGDGSVHMAYTFEGNRVAGGKSQYTFETTANYIEVTVPEDTEETSFTLDNGYIAVGVMGLTAFVDGGDSHRNIPDAGCATRESKTTWHTRSMLPDVTIRLGDLNFVNTAPEVVPDAVTEAEIMFGQKYAINPELLFTDKDGQNLTYTVSVNDGEAQPATATYKFVPAGVGIFNLTFTANDGEDTTSHTIAVTVKENPNNPGNLDFGLEFDQIKGYVTVSFEDNALRVEGEKGLKFPEALGTIVEPTKVPYAEGDNVAAVTLRLLDAMGIGYSHSGTVESSFYLGAIKNFVVDDTPYASMAEFDAGVGSGWMITLNDVFITKGCSEFDVKDGDVVRWQYTCQLGADIGDPYQDFLHENVEKLIAAIGEVTLDSKAAIEAARAAYDELNAYQQGEVENYETLTAAEARYAELVEKAEADQAAAADAESLINAIGEVTLDSKAAIDAARAAYDALTDDQKALVENYDVLTAAEDAYAALKAAADKAEADQAAAADAEALINAIGEVTKDSGEAIEAARAAYDALTDDQKALVENLDVLTAAEAEYAALMTPVELPFTDIPDAWYQDAIRFVYENGIMNGMTPTTFEPGTTLSRAMYITMIWRMEGEPAANGENTYTDVKDDFWYTDAIIWGTEVGIVNGYGDGIFKPEGNVTRQEMAKMMYCYAEYKGADMSATADFSAFKDGEKVASWAAPYMSWAVGSELMKGDPNGNLNPAGKATRAEAATVIMRFAELVK
ncbi:MAG: S-layer homology domain-containing protein, partial [Firmicutes bacterium]|nr:S-layer homology domain-containing protein [Bacillota bacterium]